MIVWLFARAFLDARSFANQSLVCMTCPLPGASFNSVDLLMLDASGDIERVGAWDPGGSSCPYMPRPGRRLREPAEQARTDCGCVGPDGTSSVPPRWLCRKGD